MKNLCLIHNFSRLRCIIVSFILLFALNGCGKPECIKIDLSGEEPRFLIHKPGWGWPFLWPRVDALSIASEEEGEVWRLKATDPTGVPARHLAVVFGQPPNGFFQELPENEAKPKPLVPGRNYFIGAVGQSLACGIGFALPVGQFGATPMRPLPGAEEVKPADRAATSAPSKPQ